MKNLLFPLFLLLGTLLVAQPSDTLSTNQTDSVQAKERGININLGSLAPTGSEDAKKSSRFKTRWIMLDMGFNTYFYNGSLELPASMRNYDQNFGKSMHWGLMFYQQRIRLDQKKHFYFYHGLGMDFMFYNFASSNVMVARQDQVTFTDTVANVTKNRLLTESFTLPIMFMYQTRTGHSWKSFRVGAGMYASVMFNANVKVKTTTDKYKISDDYNLRRFRYGIRGEIGWGPVTLYALYAINTMFKDNQGPALYPFTMGLRVIPF